MDRVTSPRKHASSFALALCIGTSAICSTIACDINKHTEVDAGAAALGTVDNSVAKAPPKLRAPHPPAPPLPDLPSLDKHEAAQKKPPEQSLTLFGNCRGTWNGDEISATGCGTVTKMLGLDEEGAVPLITEKVLPASKIGLPAIVDHRVEGTEGVVRNQGAAPACTAFAAAAAVDHAIARWLGKPAHVSVNEVWSRYRTPYEAKAVANNLGLPLGMEEDWPFDAKTAIAMMDCPTNAPFKPGTCGIGPDPRKTALMNGRAVVEFTRARKLNHTDTGSFERHIASGQDIVVTVELSDTFAPVGKPGAKYIPHYTDTPKDSGHALLIAGYASLKGGAYFLLHNSWGPAWGDAGYAWIHEATLQAHLDEAIVIEAEPLTVDGALRPKRKRGEVTCGTGLIPDSITGICTKPCPDASPRHDDVCAAAKSECPVGYVNLTGACERAAPIAHGKDESTGITYQCGPGGCAYIVPKSSDASCTGTYCEASCPAPEFRLARDRLGLTCVQ